MTTFKVGSNYIYIRLKGLIYKALYSSLIHEHACTVFDTERYCAVKDAKKLGWYLTNNCLNILILNKLEKPNGKISTNNNCNRTRFSGISRYF